MGGWWDVVVVGLRGLSPSTAALGVTVHVIETTILGGLVDLSHLKTGREMKAPTSYCLAPVQTPQPCCALSGVDAREVQLPLGWPQHLQVGQELHHCQGLQASGWQVASEQERRPCPVLRLRACTAC